MIPIWLRMQMFCLLAGIFLLLNQVAQAEQRIALVIGNGAYKAAPLRNPPNDARAMAQKLRQCSFEVIEKIDSDQRTMEGAIREFGRMLQRGGVGLFYYAGHGMQVQGTNYLIPVGAEVKAEHEIKYEAVDAGRVLSAMESAGNRVNLIILDACRNNPFTRSFRSADRGLKKMDAPKGSLLAYATAPGDVAADGEGGNGLYTSMLLKYMDTPGLPVELMFKRVRQDVRAATGDSQVPWESTSLSGDFYFIPGSPGAGSSSAPAPLTPPPAAVQFGHLQVNVNAPNSQVYVNNTYRGTASPGTPLNLQNVGLGEVTVKATASGYQEKTQRFSLQANEWTSAVLVLEPVVVAPPPAVETPSARPSGSATGGRAGETRTFRLPGGASIEMVWIEPGTFLMGSPDSDGMAYGDEKPQHRVTISQGFWLGKYELTQGQWESVMGTRPWSGENYVQAHASHPAVYISWEDVQGFIGKLNQAEGRPVYRLPTEAEWEYACRAGTSSVWPFGNDASQLGNYAWYDKNAWNIGEKYAHAVGQKRANAWGLHDMLGNVYEWCQDWKGSYSSGSQTDPTGPSSGSHRVARGGRFYRPARRARPANRNLAPPSFRGSVLGARLLRTQ